MKKVFIIAEIGQAHEGSIGIAHSYIEALAKTGIDAIKFQTHIAIAESSEFEPFRINFSYEDKTRFEYWQRMQFSIDQWIELKSHCESVGLEFISSPFSNTAVDLLEKIGVQKYKIGSGEVNNLLLIEKISKTLKPIILSSGMSNLDEIDQAIKHVSKYGNELALLQCTTSYPTKPGNWGLNLIPFFKEKYNIPVGFSDHSGKTFPSIIAASLGAEIIEFHAIFDKRMFGPDSIASLTINEIKEVCTAVRELEIENKSEISKAITPDISKIKNVFEKSLAVNKNLQPGHIIEFDDLEAKKPKNCGIPAEYYNKVIGKRLIVNKTAYSFLIDTDFEK